MEKHIVGPGWARKVSGGLAGMLVAGLVLGGMTPALANDDLAAVTTVEAVEYAPTDTEFTEVLGGDEGVISPEVSIGAEVPEALGAPVVPGDPGEDAAVGEDGVAATEVDDASGAEAAAVPAAPAAPAPSPAAPRAEKVVPKAGLPGAVTDAITSKCTVTLTMPKTIKVGQSFQSFHVNTNGIQCLDRLKIALRRTSDNVVLNTWSIYGEDSEYQSGRIPLTLPMPYHLEGVIKGNIAGKYAVEISDRHLDGNWADANNLDWQTDFPTVKVVNGVVDVRAAASAPIKLQREVGGVRITSTVQRYDAGSDVKVGMPNTRVALQKKNSVGKWVTKKTVTTNSKGKYSTLIKDSKKGTWRAVVSANLSAFAVTSGAKSVAKKSSGKAKTKISRSYDYMTLTGAVKINAGGGYYKAPAGVKVRVQKNKGGKWSTFKTVKTNSAGKVKYTASKSGSYRFVVKASSTYKSSTSSAKKFY
ncbi:5-hydroxyisourate hydrolase-like protein (transthyretin family) [Leucobacter exalbidus]|uniref:5-hydroxyisourate hydrolase-like protein (Transthyretin family) n=1 Tax=Leucobacter exalbidus TaxID=662960 RepID=A0A940T0Q9_9MICO|nr:hypothetical protein [Leucobacter exalbidus]MBP1326130.1 5-hydroxyisourate hydrolase-like protein (transthyretin family) [Leucobacter exalbidus]